MRFLYPVLYIPEVELNPSKWTTTQTIGSGWKTTGEDLTIRGRWVVFSEKIHRTDGQNFVLPFIVGAADFGRGTERNSSKRFRFSSDRWNMRRCIGPLSIVARIESLKSGNAFLIVRGRTLPQFLSSSTRIHSNGNRSELSKIARSLAPSARGRELIRWFSGEWRRTDEIECTRQWKLGLFHLHGSNTKQCHSLVQSFRHVLRMRQTLAQSKRSVSSVSKEDRWCYPSLHLTDRSIDGTKRRHFTLILFLMLAF